MIRLSSEDETAKAMRLGMFAFMRPVITSADGRCVAMMRCMPAARPICATRQMLSSTSLAAHEHEVRQLVDDDDDLRQRLPVGLIFLQGVVTCEVAHAVPRRRVGSA